MKHLAQNQKVSCIIFSTHLNDSEMLISTSTRGVLNMFSTYKNELESNYTVYQAYFKNSGVMYYWKNFGNKTILLDNPEQVLDIKDKIQEKGIPYYEYRPNRQKYNDCINIMIGPYWTEELAKIDDKLKSILFESYGEFKIRNNSR